MDIGEARFDIGWGEDFVGLGLPTDDDLREIRQLVSRMPDAAPAERFAAVDKKGLLKDLYVCFDPQTQRPGLVETGYIRKRKNVDFSKLVSAFDAVADALETGLDSARLERFRPELRIMECVVRSGDLSGRQVQRPLRARHCRFSETFGAVGTAFHAATDFRHCSFASKANFAKTRFAGAADFQGTIFESEAEFSESHFAQAADFSHATFRGRASFHNSDFHAQATFSEAVFQNLLDFRSTAFRGPAAFDRGKFADDVDFSRAEYFVDAAYDESEFQGDADFHLAVFHADAKFSTIVCAGDVLFLEAQFFGPADFSLGRFEASTFFVRTVFKNSTNFAHSRFGGVVYFNRASFSQELELRTVAFGPQSQLGVHELCFNDSTILGGKLLLLFEQIFLQKFPFSRGRILGEGSRNRRQLADACEQYGTLEANFNAQGSPDAAISRDWCHYRYMDLRRQTHYSHWNPRRWLDFLFLKAFFGYGIYTRRILASALLVVVLFAVFFGTGFFGLPRDQWSVESDFYVPQHFGMSTRPGEFEPDDMKQKHIRLDELPFWRRVGNSLYFSIITFATVGYGDWRPMYWAKSAAAAEGLLGVFIMSVFTVSFARKILR
jgi:hypothetical protein